MSLQQKQRNVNTGRTVFVRFYASDWRSGCMGLTVEQEGFYIRLCAFIYETTQRLPLDDATASRFMCMHTNKYRKILQQLIALERVQAYDDGYTVDRAERELAKAGYAKEEADDQAGMGAIREVVPQRANGGAEVSQRESGRDAGVVSYQDTHRDTPLVFVKKDEQNQGASLELRTKNYKEEKKERERVPIFPTNEGPEVATICDGKIVLSDPLEAFWLPKFGDDKPRLELALIQAFQFLQINSTHSITVQVNTQLARNAAIKRDSDSRFTSKAKQPGSAHSPAVQAKIAETRKLMEYCDQKGIR